MSRKSLVPFLLLALALPACGKIMSDYVQQGSRTPAGEPTSALTENSRELHVSPGAVWASGVHVQATLHTLPTDVKMQGMHVAAKLSLSAQRPQ